MSTPRDAREHAQQLDRSDALAPLRAEFCLPSRKDGSTAVYLCGHSLGLQPKRAGVLLQEELAAWATLGVEAHFEGPRPWVSYHELLTPGLARLAGAANTEVVAMNSLTVNLHLMLASFYRPQDRRTRILIEKSAFPSDRYAVRSHIAQRGLNPQATVLEMEAHDADGLFDTERVCETIERHAAELALILLPGVQYLTGQCLDMRTIAECARRCGCVIGFDLAHAIGNVPLALHDWNVDFAVWCSYKYLNAGPGAIGGCFVHERYARAFDVPRFAGWWGHDKSSRFAMPDRFEPLEGAEGWQLSNPSIFACTPLLASLELFERAGMQALRAKSIALTGYLEQVLSDQLRGIVTVLTPRAVDARGAQMSLRIERPAREARALHEQLTRQGYICDWREPNVIRIAPVPLYNTFSEVWEFVQALRALCTPGTSQS